jgi:hypothetical protein
LSCIFQNHRLFVPEPKDLTIEKCRELLMRPKLCAQFQDWFETELRPALGLNVYETPFPTGRGYSQYQNSLARVLLYRFEQLPRLGPILEKFLDCKVPELVNRNLGTSKEYAKVYQEVKESLTLPMDFVDGILNTTLMRHFYSETDREGLKQRWAGITQGCASQARLDSLLKPV